MPAWGSLVSAVTSLIVRFKGGRESAFHTLVTGHFPAAVSLARCRLGAGPGGRPDAEDVALSAFHRLHRAVCSGNPLADRLTDRESLVSTLAILIAQKIRRLRRDARRLKRDERRSVAATDLGPDGADVWDVLAEAKDDPAWAATFRQTWAELMGPLSDRQRAVVEGKYEGWSNAELGERLNVCGATVEREVKRIRKIWAERFGFVPPISRNSGRPDGSGGR